MAGSKAIGGDRPVRGCDLCGGVDDHPRHVIAGGVRNEWPAPSGEVMDATFRNLQDYPDDVRARVLSELMDTGSQDRHMDCCRAAGCPTGTCDQVADKRGKALLDDIMRGAE